MRFRFSAFWLPLLICCVLTAASDKNDKKHAAEIALTDVHAARTEDQIQIDAHLRNISEKAVGELTLIFEFRASDHSPVVTQRVQTDEETLEPGGEATIHAACANVNRAIEISVSAQDSRGRYHRVDKPGPYVIE